MSFSYNKRYVDRAFDAPPPGGKFVSFARLYQPRFASVVAHFEDACRASRRHSEFAASQLRVFGDHGAPISGCVRDHFPEDRKDTLRTLARQVTEASDRAHARSEELV